MARYIDTTKLMNNMVIYVSPKLAQSIIKAVDETPTEEVAPLVRGKWIAQDIHNCHTDFKCSKCGYIHNFMHLYGKPTADYTYCPYCGAKMEESEKNQ